MLPRYNDKITPQGLARLTSQFQQPNIRAWLGAILPELQALEDATWGLYIGRSLATAIVYDLPETNVVFDAIGEIVGQQRGSLSDLEMKTLIYLWVAVNRSTGRVTDWSRFAQILTPFCDIVPIFYGDQAGIYFGTWNLQLDPNATATTLGFAVPNGVRGLFHYSIWVDGNDFTWGSRYSAAAGQGAWGSRYDASIGGLWVAGASMQ
ncbi:MAG TPA: hypothetical protein VGG39_28595 [Polyangiaceae bacterium]|jgi:hypothetical protein